MALPICIARCIEHVCIVLSNLVPNKDLKVLGLNEIFLDTEKEEKRIQA